MSGCVSMVDQRGEPRRLPACPPPRTGESLLGYLMRLADLNGYRSLRKLFSLIGYRTMPRNISSIDYARLAELVNQPEELLKELSCAAVGTGVIRFQGLEVQSFSVETNRPRICLECMRADFKIKALWDLSLIVCCPEHGGYLLAECPECNEPLEWGRPAWNRCRCGCDFMEFPAHPVTNDIRAYSRYLHGKMSGDGSGPEILFNLNNTISGGSLMTLTTLLGQWSVHECYAPLDKVFKSKSMIERGSYIQATLEILNDWPNAFHEFLDRVKGKGSYPDTTILMYRHFGRLFYNLMYVYKSPDLDFVREALKEYDVRQRDELVCEGLSSEDVEGIGFHGPAKTVDFSAASLKKMARSGGVSFRKLKPVGSLRKVEITSDSKADLARRQAERLRYIDVVRLLGVRPPMARKLIDEGLLTKDVTTILDGRGNESYFRGEVEELLAGLRKIAKPISDAERAARLYPLVKAFHVYGRDGFSPLRILKEIRNGHLDAFKQAGRFDLSSVHVCHRQLSKLVLEKVIGGDNHLIDFMRAMEVFDLTKSEIKTILKHEAVEYIFRPFGGRNYSLINRAGLESFLVAHVKSDAIEVAMKKSGRYVRRFLAERGVYPIWTKIHGDTGIWYERTNLQNVGLEYPEWRRSA